jgi:hypothetical protein
MPVNNTTCRVGSNTTCQQNEISCWVHTHVITSVYVYTCTCMPTTRHVVLGPTPYVIISMYLCSYMHMNNTTCRAAFNTTCCDQHVCSFVHACQQHGMSCPVQHHTSTTRQVILSTYALTKTDLQNAMSLSMLQLINLVDAATYQLGQ